MKCSLCIVFWEQDFAMKNFLVAFNMRIPNQKWANNKVQTQKLVLNEFLSFTFLFIMPKYHIFLTSDNLDDIQKTF